MDALPKITSNVLQRIFRIKYGESCGTCFTIEVNNKQYVITAKHVVEGVDGAASVEVFKDGVEVFKDGVWQKIEAHLVGACSCKVDIAVLAMPMQLSPAHPFNASFGNVALSQDCYFLGFPYGLGTDAGDHNSGYPIPFVKKAMVSAFGEETSEGSLLYLDGHNNPGFSGGPVVITPLTGEPIPKVVAVVSGYRFDNHPVCIGDAETDAFVRYNTGIILSYSISSALALIEKKPIGFKLS